MSPEVYITSLGLAKTTGLSRDVIERAAQRLVRAGLLKVQSDARQDNGS
jgi:DNA-binding IscR family transcriptional regulator